MGSQALDEGTAWKGKVITFAHNCNFEQSTPRATSGLGPTARFGYARGRKCRSVSARAKPALVCHRTGRES